LEATTPLSLLVGLGGGLGADQVVWSGGGSW